LKLVLQAVKRAADEERHQLVEVIISAFAKYLKDEHSADAVAQWWSGGGVELSRYSS